MPALPAAADRGHYPAYRGGLPVYATLGNVAVPKKLPPFELA